MKVEAVSINQVFLTSRVLTIPFFQRSYVWEKKNWEKFFNDIAQIQIVQNEDEREPYFLGSIILKVKGNNQQKFDVIDGQQRLTTIVMFMKALYLCLGRDDLFYQQYMQLSLTNVHNPILVANHNDQAIYDQIINTQVASAVPYNDTKLANCFAYFVDRILKARTEGYEGVIVTPEQLLSCITDYVRLVSIEVQPGENAQKIFETINCAGIRLTTGELLKNYLFDVSTISLYENGWKQVFENMNREYWEGDIVKGRIKGIHLENFFYRYMLIKMQDPIVKNCLTTDEVKAFRKNDGLFENFKRLIEKCHIDKTVMINNIVDHAKLYMNIFKKHALEEAVVKYEGIERLACLMMASDSWTMTPYILYVLSSVQDENEKQKLFGYLETYLFRRMICKSANNNYSDMFSENLIGQGVNTYDAFKTYVNDAQSRGALLMPSDQDVVDAIQSKDLKRDALVLLYFIESKINSNFANDRYSNGLLSFQIESVMPEKENTMWELSSGKTVDDRAVLVKTLGNYVLLRDKLKTKERKAEWSEKKTVMNQKIDGIETSTLIGRMPQWNDETIIQRNNILADKIINNWPL